MGQTLCAKLSRGVLWLWIAAALGAATTAWAQDSHYWTNQYGTQAQLLGGAVVGRAVDLSATFYNPAAIVFVREGSGVVLTTDAFQYQIVKLEGVEVSGRDVSNSRLTPRPSIFTGLLPSVWTPGRLAYSFVTRMDVKLDMDARGKLSGDVIASIPGDETFFRETTFRQDVSDSWYGLSYSDSLDSHVAFGASAFVTYHGQRTRAQTLSQATAADGSSGATATYIDEFNYWKMGLALKFGLAFRHEPLTVGVTYTTGRIQIPIGDGQVVTARTFTGLDLDNDAIPDSDIAADEDDKLNPTYKWPRSAAVGISYDLNDVTIHSSAEWFSKVDRYTVLDARPVSTEILGITFDTEIFEERKTVINVAIGAEYRIHENFSLYGSFLTDQSAHPGISKSNHTVHTWNINHINAGISGDIVRAELTLGLGWSWGRKAVSGFDFESANESNGLLGRDKPVDVVYRNLSFLIGFSF